MFTDIMPKEFFMAVGQFMEVMETSRDFVWWADTLVVEETKELKHAIEHEDMAQVFKESADLFYVIAGFYNCMPMNPAIVGTEINDRLQKTILDAWETIAGLSVSKKIPIEIFQDAFAIVHISNMSKLGDDGKPVRREDGKILKGPNYFPPNMSSVVKLYEDFLATNPQPLETLNEAANSN